MSRAIVLAVLAVGCLAASVTSGGAFPLVREDYLEDCVDEDETDFDIDTYTDANRQLTGDISEVLDGLDDWEAIKGRDGSRVIDTDDASGLAVHVWTEDLNPQNATAGCVELVAGSGDWEPRIRIDTDDLTAAEAEATARHEFGHILWLEHTGTTEAFAGADYPAMSTCLPVPGSNHPTHVDRGISKDDWANLEFRQTDGGFNVATPNSGFEHYWSSGNPQ